MRKTIALVLVCLLVSMAAVAAYGVVPSGKIISLKQKDPSTWEPIVGGMSGKVTLTKATTMVCTKYVLRYGRQVCVSYGPKTVEKASAAVLAKPNTQYTLIYYGYDGFNDVWPHATCIGTFKTAKAYWPSVKYTAGMVSAPFEWSGMINDGIDQKFWVVPSADLDCANHQFVAWNPTGILFEASTI